MKQTDIQWAHSTINPVMGCDGCELWPGIGKVANDLAAAIKKLVGAGGGATGDAGLRGWLAHAALPERRAIVNRLRNDRIGELSMGNRAAPHRAVASFRSKGCQGPETSVQFAAASVRRRTAVAWRA